MVVPETVFIHIALKALGTDGVINPTDASLDQAPKAFDGVGMHVPDHVDLRRMVDAMVLVPVLL
jgi:hypothetical protein